ncbi:MAG: helix-turn-helix transcriptional regulator [Actinobacteria bacterium]|nr:helix-turn-helix transcriptional regulator [Actinomycetota bacterium]
MNKTIYSDEQKYLSQRLRQAREEAHLDQKTAGQMLGKSQSYISKIEAGQLRVDVVQLKEFARVYGKRFIYFIRK